MTEKNVEKEKNTKLENRDKLGEAQYMFQTVNDWIHVADNKISLISSIMFAVYSIIGVYIVNFISKITNYQDKLGLKILVIVLFGLSLGCFVAILITMVVAIKPRWFGKDYKPSFKNSYFYADVNSYNSKEEFIKKVKKETYDERVNAIYEEVYINSQICTRKMRCLTIIMVLLPIAFGLDILSILLSFFAR